MFVNSCKLRHVTVYSVIIMMFDITVSSSCRQQQQLSARDIPSVHRLAISHSFGYRSSDVWW